MHTIPNRYILIGMDTATSNERATMILTIELTDTEYVATQNALAIAIQEVRTLTVPQQLEVQHLRTLLAEASISERHNDGATDDAHITAPVYLQALTEQWNDTGVTMDEARGWYDLPPIRQIQVVERMLSVVGLMVALTEPDASS